MTLCFAGVGWNVWLIDQGTGGVWNYIAAAVCLGSGLYGMASLVRYP